MPRTATATKPQPATSRQLQEAPPERRAPAYPGQSVMSDPTMQRLRDAAAAALASPTFPQDLATWLAAGIARYEEGAGTVGLDVALGLGRPGARGWWTREAEEARNVALKLIWRERFPGLSDREAAREIAALGRRRSAVVAQAAMHGPIPGPKQVLNILRK